MICGTAQQTQEPGQDFVHCSPPFFLNLNFGVMGLGPDSAYSCARRIYYLELRLSGKSPHHETHSLRDGVLTITEGLNLKRMSVGRFGVMVCLSPDCVLPLFV